MGSHKALDAGLVYEHPGEGMCARLVHPGQPGDDQAQPAQVYEGDTGIV